MNTGLNDFGNHHSSFVQNVPFREMSEFSKLETVKIRTVIKPGDM